MGTVGELEMTVEDAWSKLVSCSDVAKGLAIWSWCAWPKDNANCSASANSAQHVPERVFFRNQRKQVTNHFVGSYRDYAMDVMPQNQLVALFAWGRHDQFRRADEVGPPTLG